VILSSLSRASFVLQVNQLLNSHEAVGYLDCDLGQTEFTPAGMVSLHAITEPVFGPTYMHLRTPASACNIGATSPKDTPLEYMHGARFFGAVIPLGVFQGNKEK
jgi:polynucleotide 5'-kinase involved in rRNA processing